MYVWQMQTSSTIEKKTVNENVIKTQKDCNLSWNVFATPRAFVKKFGNPCTSIVILKNQWGWVKKLTLFSNELFSNSLYEFPLGFGNQIYKSTLGTWNN